MIKVYIFVTGLVLYQFASMPGGSSYAILASGKYTYPDPIPKPTYHQLAVYAGDDPTMITLASLEAELKVNCPGGGCAPVKAPAEIPALSELVPTPTIQSDCITPGDNAAKKCLPGRNGLLIFTGNWTVEPLTDCGNSFPSPVKKLKMNFVRAERAWELCSNEENEPLELEVANSVLFSTVVAKIQDLQNSSDQLRALLDPHKVKDCKGFPGFPDFQRSGGTSCAVVLIRNGATRNYYRGGDLDFAGIYALLNNNLDPAQICLPITTTKVCPQGAHGAGLSHCIGARLP